jgi:hypothetical protein
VRKSCAHMSYESLKHDKLRVPLVDSVTLGSP